MIDDYTTGGCMTVDGTRYCRDLKIVRGQVRADWWRREGHLLELADIRDILESRPEVLVVGTGFAGRMRIPDAFRSHLDRQGIHLVAKTTQDAVKVFNQAQSEGKTVAGAFHLTC